MLLNLRGQRELTDRRRRFKVESREIDRLLRAIFDHFDDTRQRLTLGQIARPGLVDMSAKRVVQLQRIDAQMNVRSPQTGCGDETGQSRDGALHLRRLHEIDQLLEQRLQRLRQQVIAVRLGDDVRCFREVIVVVLEAFDCLDLLVDRGNAEIELADDLARDALRTIGVVELVLQDDEALANVGKRRSFSSRRT